MPKIERIEKIKQLLAHQNRIDVNQLSQLLNVSKVTIRNDLKLLETEGVLKRTHGGQSPTQSHCPAPFHHLTAALPSPTPTAPSTESLKGPHSI